MWAKTWGSGSATKTDCLHMVGTDTGLKGSNPVCEGKGNTGASTVGGDCHILCYLCPSCCKYLWPSKRRKQTEQTTQVLLRVCAREQSLTAYCMMYMAPCTSPKLNFSQNSWERSCWSVQSPSPACAQWAVIEHLTFTAYSVCLLSVFRSRGRANQAPLFLFHFTFRSSFTMSNCSGCKYWWGIFHYREGFNYLLHVSLEYDSEE